MFLRERVVSALCCVLIERSGVFLVFPTSSSPSPFPDRSFFQQVQTVCVHTTTSSMTGPSHAACNCNVGRDLHFRLDRYRDAACYHCSEDLPLNCCNCSAAGRAQRLELEWVRRQLDPPATFSSILSQNVQLSTNDGAFARRVSSATCTTGERSLPQPPNPSSSHAPTSLTFGSKKTDKDNAKQQKRKIEDNSNCSQPLACAQASHPVLKRGKGRLSAHPDRTIAVLDQTSAIFSLHNRAAGRGPYISYGRNLQTCLKAGPPPLDLSFWSFLTFLHHGIEEVERHLL